MPHKGAAQQVIFFAENLNNTVKCEHHYGLNPNPYTSRKSKHARKNLVCLLFFCSF